MPDTRDIEALYARLTDGADSDAERKQRIEQFARALQAATGSSPTLSLAANANRTGAPLVPIARDPRAATPGAAPTPGPPLRVTDDTTETVPAAGLETAPSAALIVPQGATRQDMTQTPERFREKRRTY